MTDLFVFHDTVPAPRILWAELKKRKGVQNDNIGWLVYGLLTENFETYKREINNDSNIKALLNQEIGRRNWDSKGSSYSQVLDTKETSWVNKVSMGAGLPNVVAISICYFLNTELEPRYHEEALGVMFGKNIGEMLNVLQTKYTTVLSVYPSINLKQDLEDEIFYNETIVIDKKGVLLNLSTREDAVSHIEKHLKEYFEANGPILKERLMFSTGYEND